MPLKKKILILSSDAFSLVNFRGTFIARLVNEGHIVYCMAPKLVGEFEIGVSALGAYPINIQMSRNSFSPFLFLTEIFNLYKILKRLKIEVLLSYFMQPNIIAGFTGRLFRNLHFVALVEGAGYVFDDSAKGLFRKILKYIIVKIMILSFKSANTVVFLNAKDHDEYCKLGITNNQFAVILGPIGVDLGLYHRVRECQNNKLIFIMCARLIKEKGIQTYINAAKVVYQKNKNVRFLLLGGVDSNPSSYTNEEMLRLLADSPVEWQGHVNVRPFLREADVFVLPTYYREGVPRSIQEAMASSLPIITTDIDGCRELVCHGKSGFLIQPRSVNELVSYMFKFINNPEIILAMGREARNFAEINFDFNKIDEKLMKIVLPLDS